MTTFRSARDVIVRTEAFTQAVQFYAGVLGLRMCYETADLVGFETGAFCLYVERGEAHGPVFELLVPDVAAARAQLVAAGCTVVEEDAGRPRCYLRDPYGVTFNIGKAAPLERAQT